MKSNSIFKLALSGLYSALALIAFTIESLFPPLFLPGARMGISNVFILLAAITLGAKHGYVALVIKTILGSLFSANVSALMYSLPAGIIALSVELILLKFTKHVSIIALSVVGSVINVCVQNTVFCIVTKTMNYLIYSPYLALIGVLGGIIVGLTVHFTLRRLPIIKKNKMQTDEQVKEN